MIQLKDKRVLVVGLGKTGIASIKALCHLGAAVSVQDEKREADIDSALLDVLKCGHVTGYFGRVPDDPAAFDMYLLSPGVPPALPFIRAAAETGIEITGELEIAGRIGKGRFAAITGTNGKTTTTTLTGEIFKKAGYKTQVVGNIGDPVIDAVLTADEDTWLVTEVSSFQLETTRDFKPHVSALLNLTPDHMDRHGSMEEYGQQKAKIFRNQDAGDFCVINRDDPAACQLADGCRATIVPFSRKQRLDCGVFVQDGTIALASGRGAPIPLCQTSELLIPGAHNLENALAAAAIAHVCGIPEAVIAEVLRTFIGVAHRLEFCGEKEGVRFVNDSKGTNPVAAIKALEAIDGPIILIAGGYDKDADFAPFVDAFAGKVKFAALMGKTADKIQEVAARKGFTGCACFKDMEACVKEAAARAKPGDTVLLSPACASWDMYTDYEQRGAHFKTCVAKL